MVPQKGFYRAICTNAADNIMHFATGTALEFPVGRAINSHDFTKGGGGLDAIFGFLERAFAGLGHWHVPLRGSTRR